MIVNHQFQSRLLLQTRLNWDCVWFWELKPKWEILFSFSFQEEKEPDLKPDSKSHLYMCGTRTPPTKIALFFFSELEVLQIEYTTHQLWYIPYSLILATELLLPFHSWVMKLNWDLLVVVLELGYSIGTCSVSELSEDY